MSFYESLISILFGILASFVAWFLVSNIICPRLEILDKLFKERPIAEDGAIFKIKVINHSRYYSVFDVKMQGRIRIKGLIDSDFAQERIFTITIGSGSTPYIKPTKDGPSRRFKLQNKKQKKSDPLQLITIYNKQFPDATKDLLTIEDIFDIGTEVKLEVSITCTHAFSGARKLFSKEFSKENIIEESTPQFSDED